MSAFWRDGVGLERNARERTRYSELLICIDNFQLFFCVLRRNFKPVPVLDIHSTRVHGGEDFEFSTPNLAYPLKEIKTIISNSQIRNARNVGPFDRDQFFRVA